MDFKYVMPFFTYATVAYNYNTSTTTTLHIMVDPIGVMCNGMNIIPDYMKALLFFINGSRDLYSVWTAI